MPPCFGACARAGPIMADAAAIRRPAVGNDRSARCTANPPAPRLAVLRRPCLRSVIKPDVLEAPAVILAVRHDGDVAHPRPPAGRPPLVEYDRPRHVLLQLLVD